MSDLKNVDIPSFVDVSEKLSPLNLERYDRFKRDVRPRITPTKPMLYTAAGYDLGSVLGSGVDTATMIDPVYSKKSDSKYSGVLSLVEQIMKIDPSATIEVSGYQTGVVKGEFTFMAEGRKKNITAIGSDAVGYKELGDHSVYLSMGHPVPQLFLPGCEAEAYVISHISPEAWGYRDIVTPFRGEEGLPIATDYQALGLTEHEMSVLTELNLSRVMDSIRHGKADRIKTIFSGLVAEDLSQAASLEEVIFKHWEKRFSVLATLNPYSRNAYIKDMSSYINDIFSDLTPDDQMYGAGQSLLQALAKNQ